MEKQPKSKTFVIGGIKKDPNDKYSGRESYYFPLNSAVKLFENLIVVGYQIRRCFFNYQPESVKYLINNQPFEDSTSLESFVIEGDFKLNLKNRKRNEKDYKDVGPYRGYCYNFSWNEVEVEITADEEKSIQAIEEMLRKSAVPAFSSNKTIMDHGAFCETFKKEYFGKGINEKIEKV